MEPNHKVEVVIHLNQTLQETNRNDLTTTLRSHAGIYSAEFCPLREHLMLVDYDNEQLNSNEVLHMISSENISAQLIGPI